jgi:hypothetical protein
VTSPSPCTLCASLADCTTCVPRLAWEGAQIAPDPLPCAVCTDIEVLTLSGELPEQVAARMHMHPESITRHLKRCGRHDLLPQRRTA